MLTFTQTYSIEHVRNTTLSRGVEEQLAFIGADWVVYKALPALTLERKRKSASDELRHVCVANWRRMIAKFIHFNELDNWMKNSPRRKCSSFFGLLVELVLVEGISQTQVICFVAGPDT